jgi:tRNA dimethylallyltransferase
MSLAPSIQIIGLVGPTSVGKTEIAIQLAQLWGVPVISCDSMQIYRYMDIGTAKPSGDILKKVPHRMIDIVDPDGSYDADMYRESAGKEVNKVLHQGKPALVCGGTGFYFRALVDGLFDGIKIPIPFREELAQRWSPLSNLELYAILVETDPTAAKKVHANDRKRVFRALEVYAYTGKKISEFHQDHYQQPKPFRTLIFGIQLDRETLYERIERRVAQMLKAGWVEEVESLRQKGYPPKLRSMQGLGYKRINLFLDQKINEIQMIEAICQDTRHYAKRQFTWFRSDSRIHWIDTSKTDAVDCINESVLKGCIYPNLTK